jgi:hypothetical protein
MAGARRRHSSRPRCSLTATHTKPHLVKNLRTPRSRQDSVRSGSTSGCHSSARPPGCSKKVNRERPPRCNRGASCRRPQRARPLGQPDPRARGPTSAYRSIVPLPGRWVARDRCRRPPCSGCATSTTPHRDKRSGLPSAQPTSCRRSRPRQAPRQSGYRRRHTLRCSSMRHPPGAHPRRWPGHAELTSALRPNAPRARPLRSTRPRCTSSSTGTTRS